MPTGIEETIALAATEAATEATIEAATEVGKETILNLQDISETKLSEIPYSSDALIENHKMSLDEYTRIHENLEGFKTTGKTAKVGTELSKKELERRGNTLLKEEMPYHVSSDTEKSYRADLYFETKPGSSIRELEKVGDRFVPKEKIFSTEEKLLIDSKHHEVYSFKKNIGDTLVKATRMIKLSPNDITCISLPDDIGLEPSCASYVQRIIDTGARVILHAPKNLIVF